MAALVQFMKMNGLGNKIIVADMRGRSDGIAPKAVLALNASQQTSFDQIMVIRDPSTPATDQSIHILNSDASVAEACGNGTRCVVKALAGETSERDFTFETAAGIVTAQYRHDGLISVDMGLPRFGWRDVPLSQAVPDTRAIDLDISLDDVVLRHPSVASMGNPHVIFWVDEDVHSVPLERIGPIIEHHPLFPQLVNVTIAQVSGENELSMRTWERGAGLTLACGSAACATAVSAARTGRTGRNVKITLPGGELWVRWLGNDHVLMTGAAEMEFSGTFDPESGAWSRNDEVAS